MNRRIAIAAAVLAVSLGTLSLVAQQGGRGGPGGPGGIMPGLNRMDLSDAQHEQVRAVLEQERQSGNPGEKVRQAEQALQAAVLGDTPNPQAVESAKAALNAARAAELDHRVELMQRIAQILTPAQRQTLAQMPGPGGRGRND